jgi:hypothetical protein
VVKPKDIFDKTKLKEEIEEYFYFFCFCISAHALGI